MMIGQEQLMKLKVGVGERSWSWRRETPLSHSNSSLQLKTPPKSFAWKIIEFAFYLYLAAVLAICLWIAIFG